MSISRLSKITIDCENGEYYSIPVEYVVSVWLEDISRNVGTDAVKQVSDNLLAKRVILELKNHPYTSEPVQKRGIVAGSDFIYRMREYRDIISITLYTLDSSQKIHQETYYVDFSEDDGVDAFNPNQFQNFEYDRDEDMLIIEIWNSSKLK